MKKIIFVLLMLVSFMTNAQVLFQDGQIILTIEDNAIWIEPAVPGTKYIAWNGLDKLDFAWTEFTTKEWLLPYDYCIGHTLYLLVERYNEEGLNRIGHNKETYVVGNYEFFITGKKK
jgi:hypothetical protein